MRSPACKFRKMFTSISKMKNLSEKDLLQKELAFYTNLLAQHEKNEEKKNLPCTSSLSSNAFIKKPNMTYNNLSSKPSGNRMYTFNKTDFKTMKRGHATRNNYIYSYQKEKNISPPQTTKNKQLYPTCSSMFAKLNVKAPTSAFTVISRPKLKNNYCKSNPKLYDSKKLAFSDASTKPLMNKEAFSKSDSKALTNRGTFAELYSNPLMNKETSIKSDSRAIVEASAKSNSKPLMNQKAPSRSESKVLMGEIKAVTEQLKIKSKNKSASVKPSNCQSTFRKINNSVKADEKINFLSSVTNNSCTNLSDVKATVSLTRYKNKLAIPANCKKNVQNGTVPKSQFIQNDEPCQKNKVMHMVLLNKLNAVEKLLNATTRNSTKAMNEVKRAPPKDKAKANNHSGVVNSKSPKEPISFHKSQLVTSVNLDLKSTSMSSRFLKKKDFRLKKNVSTNNSLTPKNYRIVKFNQVSKLKLLSAPKEAKHLSSSTKLTKTPYKIINKSRQFKKLTSVGDNFVGNINKHINSNIQKNTYSLVNNHNASSKLVKTAAPKTCSKKMLVNRSHPGSYSLTRNVCSPLKKTPNKVFKKFSPHLYRLVVKNKQNLSSSESYKFSKNLLENATPSSSESSGIDVDLLLELAAENKKKLFTMLPTQRRLYKSKSRLVNSYSIQARTAKMIKSKYFNPCKKSTDSKHLLFANKSFKECRTYNASSHSKRSKSFPRRNELKSRKGHQRKIVSLRGEKFIVGSTGKTLKKLHIHNQSTKTEKMYRKSFKWKSVIKTPTPVSKIIASRALNRSITQALSASTKKRMQKINTYCMFYNRFGRCNKGINCAFVHDPSKIAVCTRFLRGTCKSDNCLFSHEINPGKMAICSFFLQNACTKDNCPYLHEKLTPDAELCKAFVQGYCPHGKDCKKAHILICSKFLRGLCDKGKDCNFPHPMEKDKFTNPKSSDDNQKNEEFRLETVLRYFESNPQESLTRGLVVPKIKSLPEQPAFISLTLNETT